MREQFADFFSEVSQVFLCLFFLCKCGMSYKFFACDFSMLHKTTLWFKMLRNGSFINSAVRAFSVWYRMSDEGPRVAKNPSNTNNI